MAYNPHSESKCEYVREQEFLFWLPYMVLHVINELVQLLHNNNVSLKHWEVIGLKILRSMTIIN